MRSFIKGFILPFNICLAPETKNVNSNFNFFSAFHFAPSFKSHVLKEPIKVVALITRRLLQDKNIYYQDQSPLDLLTISSLVNFRILFPYERSPLFVAKQ